ncbi:MAG: peptidylprolyl isomerase [Ignavibacteriales bacterium]
MNKKLKLKLFLIVFLGLFFISKPSISGEIIDRVAAVVNDDVITLSEVKEETLLINQSPGPEGPQTQDQVLENIIEEKLLEQEAKKLGIQVTEKDVDAGIEGVKAKFNLTDEQMVEVLKKQHLTPQTFREQWRRQLLANKLIGTQVQGQIAVTEDEIKKYYEENNGKLESTSEVRIAHILIPVASPDEEEQAQKLSLEVAKLAKSGKNFGELAKKYSKDTSSAGKGGDLGYFKKGELAEALEKAVEAAPVGEIVGPVRSSDGYHIIKVIDKKKSETTSLDKSKEDEIRETLYQQKVDSAIKAWLEDVKKTAYIEKKL